MPPMGCQGNSTTPATHASLGSEVQPAYMCTCQGRAPAPHTSTVVTTLCMPTSTDNLTHNSRRHGYMQQPPWIHAATAAAMNTWDTCARSTQTHFRPNKGTSSITSSTTSRITGLLRHGECRHTLGEPHTWTGPKGLRTGASAAHNQASTIRQAMQCCQT